MKIDFLQGSPSFLYTLSYIAITPRETGLITSLEIMSCFTVIPGMVCSREIL